MCGSGPGPQRSWVPRLLASPRTPTAGSAGRGRLRDLAHICAVCLASRVARQRVFASIQRLLITALIRERRFFHRRRYSCLRASAAGYFFPREHRSGVRSNFTPFTHRSRAPNKTRPHDPVDWHRNRDCQRRRISNVEPRRVEPSIAAMEGSGSASRE
jgi:hypothetical protein